MSRLLDIALFVGQRLFWLGNGAALAVAFGLASPAQPRPVSSPLAAQAAQAPAPAAVPEVHVHVAAPSAPEAPLVLPPLRLSELAMARGCRKALQTGITEEENLGLFVSREELRRILDHTSNQGRLTPEVREGRTIGLRLSGVQNDSKLRRLGFENGDLLMSVNGFEIAFPVQALEAYARLPSWNKMTVQIERRGVHTRQESFLCQPTRHERENLEQRSWWSGRRG